MQKKSITLKIEGLPPLVYRTKLMHFLETKLTLSSHTWGDLRSNWSSTSIQGSACYKLIIHITHHLLLNFASSFRSRDRPVAFAWPIRTTPRQLLAWRAMQSRFRRSDNGILQPRRVPRTLSESHVIPGERKSLWGNFYK